MSMPSGRDTHVSTSSEADMSLPATPSSNNMFTASDVYHTDSGSDSGDETPERDPLQPEVGHLLSETLTEEEVGYIWLYVH